MYLQDDELKEFAEIWEQEFNETLSLDEARAEASRLLELCALLSKPLSEDRSDVSDPNHHPT
jgi:hypothetical protein